MIAQCHTVSMRMSGRSFSVWRQADCAEDAMLAPASRLAIFSYTPEKRVDAQLDVCFEPGILIGATVSIYIDQIFTW